MHFHREILIFHGIMKKREENAMQCPVCREKMHYEEYQNDVQGPIVDAEYSCLPFFAPPVRTREAPFFIEPLFTMPWIVPHTALPCLRVSSVRKRKVKKNNYFYFFLKAQMEEPDAQNY